MDENTQGAKIRAKKGATLPPGSILLAACLNLLAVIFLGDTISVGSQVIPTNNWKKCLALKHAWSDKFLKQRFRIFVSEFPCLIHLARVFCIRIIADLFYRFAEQIHTIW